MDRSSLFEFLLLGIETNLHPDLCNHAIHERLRHTLNTRYRLSIFIMVSTDIQLSGVILYAYNHQIFQLSYKGNCLCPKLSLAIY
jgi:hypothetical protein